MFESVLKLALSL